MTNRRWPMLRRASNALRGHASLRPDDPSARQGSVDERRHQLHRLSGLPADPDGDAHTGRRRALDGDRRRRRDFRLARGAEPARHVGLLALQQLHPGRRADVHPDGRGAVGDRNRRDLVSSCRIVVPPPAGGARDRHGVGLRRLRLGLRLEPGDGQHDRRHGGAADDAARLPRHARARLDRGRRHAGHPDPAQHLNDRLRRDHRHLDRPSVHGRHRAGHPARHADVGDHRGLGLVPPGLGAAGPRSADPPRKMVRPAGGDAGAGPHGRW